MNDAQLLRYSRHILLPELGIEGQQRLLNSHALVVGAGGLGSPVALYLASAGVGHITLVDDDRVDATNLQRQIAHREATVGWLKVESARHSMQELNPDAVVTTVAQRADAGLLDRLVPTAQVVVDCCDNFRTRHAINAACQAHGVPLVSGAAIGFDGQVAVYHPGHGDSPCYACVFPPESEVSEVACATMGVFAPLVGIVGTVQAAEALKLLAGVGEPLVGQLLMVDARSMEWTRLRSQRRLDCPVCSPVLG